MVYQRTVLRVNQINWILDCTTSSVGRRSSVVVFRIPDSEFRTWRRVPLPALQPPATPRVKVANGCTTVQGRPVLVLDKPRLWCARRLTLMLAAISWGVVLFHRGHAFFPRGLVIYSIQILLTQTMSYRYHRYSM